MRLSSAWYRGPGLFAPVGHRMRLARGIGRAETAYMAAPVVATPWAHLFVVLPRQPLAAVQNVCEVGRRAEQAERHDLDCPSAATDLLLIALQLLELVVLGSGEVRPLGIVLGCVLRRHARRRAARRTEPYIRSA